MNPLSINISELNPVVADIALTPPKIELEFIASHLASIPVSARRNQRNIRDDGVYSIAVRSSWIAMYLQKLTGRTDLALHGLMYHSACAYLGDAQHGTDIEISKRRLAPKCGDAQHGTDIELDVRRAIYLALDMPTLTPDDVTLIQQAQQQVIYIESEAFLPGCANIRRLVDATAKSVGFYPGVEPWIAASAFQHFFETLKKGERL